MLLKLTFFETIKKKILRTLDKVNFCCMLISS